MKVVNYARNVRFTPAEIVEPESLDELSEIVRASRTLRVMGAKHSWSRGIVTGDTLVSLDGMNRILEVDREHLQVRVQAGIRLHELIEQLAEHGLALENLGSIAAQSLAGAIATGTHGTGREYRCLADQVESLRLVDGEGNERSLSREHPDFDAAVVGLGALGVVHEMTLDVVPRFRMHAITETLPFDEVIAQLDRLLLEWDHFKFWWLVPSDDVIVFKQRRTDEPCDESDLQRWLKDEVLAVGGYRAMLALQKLRRDPLVGWTNRVIGREYGKRRERVCRAEHAFLTPDPPVHRESEWAFDLDDPRGLLREYRLLLRRSGHGYSFIQEIRFTQEDPFWLSPAYGRDSIWLTSYNVDTPRRWGEQLQLFSAFARAHGGRPHWGKESVVDRAYLHQAFPRLGDFAALRPSYDPGGRFINEWLRELFGPTGSAFPPPSRD